MKNETRLQRYTIKDITNKGAFIKMPSTHVHKDMQLSLIFVIQLGSVMKMHRIISIVSRVSADGIGVRFMTKPTPAP